MPKVCTLLKITFPVLFSLLFLNSKGQSIEPFQFPEKVSSAYTVDAKTEYDKMMENPSKMLSKRDYSRFAELMAYQKQDLFNSGKVYTGWTEMENYLNQVMQNILPAGFKQNNNLKVYALKDADFNAFAIHDGTFYFNIGFFAEIHNEASLAIILGHEFSHYQNGDLLLSFAKDLKLKRKGQRAKINLEERAANAHMDQQQEKTADRIGYELANSAGYNLLNGFNNFDQFRTLDRKAELNKSEKISIKGKSITTNDSNKTFNKISLKSHPEHEERIHFLKNYINSISVKGANDFLLNPGVFESLQKQARIETLQILLDQFQYSGAIEKAFTWHLSTPENSDYVYYIIEGIRRLTVLKPGSLNKGFLSDEFRNVLPKGEGILHRMDLLLDSTDFALVHATEYLDNAYEFETYKDAFNWFSQLALMDENTEAIFSVALTKGSEEQKELLQKYIRLKGKYSDYANALLTGINPQENYKRKIVLFEDLTMLEDHAYGFHNRQIKADKKQVRYENALEKYFKKEYSKELLSKADLKKNNLQLSIKYHNAVATIGMLQKLKNKRIEKNVAAPEVDMFLLDPAIWKLFHDENIYSLDYVKATSFDDRSVAIREGITSALPMINRLLYGSARYNYDLLYYSWSVNNSGFTAKKEVMAKMRPSHVMNTLSELIDY